MLSAIQPCINLLKCNSSAHLDRSRSTRAFLKRSIIKGARVTSGDPSVYNDTWFDQLAIHHCSHVIQDLAGIKVKEQGYEGFVEACRAVYKSLNAVQQREFSLKTLYKAYPPQIFYLIRVMAKRLDLSSEMLAAVVSLCCGWLVGPSEVRGSELGGTREKNVIYVKKCRFLENSNCVGMCINQCKFPTQIFLKDALGMPVNMIPNFEDMSCEIRFGEEPPAPDDDPALKQPCYKLCKISKRHTQSQSCST
ncbi:Beta-carotene isomerase d27 [Dionaea muscipula]